MAWREVTATAQSERGKENANSCTRKCHFGFQVNGQMLAKTSNIDRPLLADLGRLAQDSRLLPRKNHGVSRPAETAHCRPARVALCTLRPHEEASLAMLAFGVESALVPAQIHLLRTTARCQSREQGSPCLDEVIRHGFQRSSIFPHDLCKLRGTDSSRSESFKPSFDPCDQRLVRHAAVCMKSCTRKDGSAFGLFSKRPLLAELGRSAQHSMLPDRKSHGRSRPSGTDPKRPFRSTSIIALLFRYRKR
jgi:hypothetical protein